VAFWNLTCDSRVSFTKESICQAAMMGRTRIVELHLQDTNFKAEYVHDALVEACTRGRQKTNIAMYETSLLLLCSMVLIAADLHSKRKTVANGDYWSKVLMDTVSSFYNMAIRSLES
jgi:hypothetical protein